MMSFSFPREKYSLDADAARAELRRDVAAAKSKLRSDADIVFGQSALVAALADAQRPFLVEDLAVLFFGSTRGDTSKQLRHEKTIAAFLQHRELVSLLKSHPQGPMIAGIGALNVEGFKDEPTETKLAVISMIEGVVDKTAVTLAYSAWDMWMDYVAKLTVCYTPVLSDFRHAGDLREHWQSIRGHHLTALTVADLLPDESGGARLGPERAKELLDYHVERLAVSAIPAFQIMATVGGFAEVFKAFKVTSVGRADLELLVRRAADRVGTVEARSALDRVYEHSDFTEINEWLDAACTTYYDGISPASELW